VPPRVHEIAERIAPHIRRTPLIPTPGGGHLKLESVQPTGSFKVRGFFAAALALDPETLGSGLLTVSSGNAALACAHVARELGVPCRVVMPDTAPLVKAEGVRGLGADVETLPPARFREWIANREWERASETFIHPFNDPMVMAGHGSLALEVLADLPDVRRILVPVGGGGLACGIATALRELCPDAAVIGVQSDGYPLWREAFAAGGAVSLQPDTIADGTTAPFDAAMFELLPKLISRWVLIPESGLREAVALLAAECKVVAEGAGALGYAALIREPARERTVAVVSGGNIDRQRLATLLRQETASPSAS
jgi:threonine dehydratase